MERNIYKIKKELFITSDEEIKEGDWYYHLERKTIHNTLEKVDYFVNNTKYDKFKKIILTTDQDLIKDGVQAIDDEFLEWFVKNPSCEFVETKRIIKEYVDDQDAYGYDVNYYKIIIPKEDKKEIIEETLEEALDRLYPYEVGYSVSDRNFDIISSRQIFTEGVEWKAKRMYSEEDIKEIFKIAQTQKNYGDYKPYTYEEAIQLWKEQQYKIVYYEKQG